MRAKRMVWHGGLALCGGLPCAQSRTPLAQARPAAIVALAAVPPAVAVVVLAPLPAAASPQAAGPARGSDVSRWAPLVDEASARFGIPRAWIEQVMLAESAGLAEIDGRPIRSPKGAIGLMQIMPATWAELRERLGLGSDPDLPRDNILAGAYYLRLLYERYGYPGLFAAYNAGPARYERYLAGVPLPAETRSYVARIASRPGPSDSLLAGIPGRLPVVSLAPDGLPKRGSAMQTNSPADPLFALGGGGGGRWSGDGGSFSGTGGSAASSDGGIRAVGDRMRDASESGRAMQGEGGDHPLRPARGAIHGAPDDEHPVRDPIFGVRNTAASQP